MKLMAKKSNTTFRNNQLFCLNCGRSQEVPYPIQIDMMTAMTTAFIKIHRGCEPTWKEPEVNMDTDMLARAHWWITHCRVGMSSRTMWNYFMGKEYYEVNHPYDPDDFSRCYRLLKTVPEWKTRIPELATLSTPWKNLSENWDKLTEMFEQNEREAWKNYKKIGMYELMQRCIEPEKLNP